ncbi:MAG: DsbA family oxidoreductase [Daejeonella sp.]
MKKIKIDIVSDLVCPWCYIGQKRLNDALSEGKYEAEISWKPFQLHPELEKEGMEKEAFLMQKFGAKGSSIFDQMKAVAVSEGLEMNPDEIKNIPNTINVHRLMWFARKSEKDQALAKALFKAYFSEGKDFSNDETLLEIGERVGLDKIAIAEFLDSQEAFAEVDLEERSYREAGINAVPTFILNDKYMIQGAQNAETFIKAFEQLEVEMTADFQCTGDNC